MTAVAGSGMTASQASVWPSGLRPRPTTVVPSDEMPVAVVKAHPERFSPRSLASTSRIRRCLCRPRRPMSPADYELNRMLSSTLEFLKELPVASLV